jgi:hypothetical protein
MDSDDELNSLQSTDEEPMEDMDSDMSDEDAGKLLLQARLCADMRSFLTRL